MLTHGNLVAAARQVGAGLGYGEGDAVLAVAPFAHVMGFVVALAAPLAAGATVVTMPRFDLAAALGLVERHRITVLPVPPPVMAALASHPLVDRHDVSSLELIVSGGAPLGAALQEAVARRLPHAAVGQGYGLTETAVGITMPDRRTGTAPGSAGRLMPSTELRVVDPRTGCDLGVGERGELVARGPQVMAGYLGRPDATAAVLDAAGWLRTGDLGSIDAAGDVNVCDRLKELIKVNAHQVAPAELEALLMTHPNVADAAVVGRPDTRRGEVPVAVVVPRGALDADALIGWAAERTAPYKRLAEVRVAERIPRTPAGKILRRRLADRRERASRRAPIDRSCASRRSARMPRMRRLLSAAAVLGLLALAPAAGADPTGRSTLRETVQPGSGSGYVPLVKGKGEAYVVRRGGSAKAKRQRAARRRSLAFFAQLTDPQIADEMSPARVDFVDPAGGALKSAWRPQEALGLQTFDAIVRNIDANRRSAVRGAKGRRAQLGFALTTGDLADNQQLNETRWFRTVLDGGTVDPFSGKPVGAGQCSTDPAETARLNADVAARRYTGVADYDDWRGAPTDRYAGFYDPDEAAPTPGPYSAFPRYAGLLERAQSSFRARGLDVPWYISRGNHDGLIQGNAVASTDLFRAIAVGCIKVFPNPQIDPAAFAGASESELFQRFADPAFIQSLLAGGRLVPPDPDRRIVSKAEYRRLMREGDRSAHGFGDTSRSELSKSGGTASYYATTPKRGVRIISLDTVAEGGGQNGNLDDPQYRWLKRELRKARKRDQLVVVFGHHTLGTMSNATADEAGGRVPARRRARLRRRPAHVDAAAPRHDGQGDRPRAARRHAERGRLRRRPHPPQPGHVQRRRGRQRVLGDQHRLAHRLAAAEPADRDHGQPRRHALAVRHDARRRRPAGGAPRRAARCGMSLPQLVSLSRSLSYNDPQREGAEGSGGSANKTGGRRDRNVELLVRDPR